MGWKEMNILAANLKHLYQRRGLWPAYGFFALLIYPSVVTALDYPLAGKGYFVGLIALQLLIGICIASLQVEILTKPFSYCLPGHRKVPEKFVLLVGVITSFVGSLIFIAYPDLLFWERPFVIIAAFCAGLAMYCLGVFLAFVIRNPGSIGFLPAIFLAYLYLRLHVAVELVVVRTPSVAISLGLTSGAVVWIWLGHSNWARRFCATSRISLFDLWNQGRLIEYTRKQAFKQYKALNHPEPWVERLFTSRMNSHDYQTPGRYIWGALYTTYAMALSQWKTHLRNFMLLLFLALFMSYIQARGTSILFFITGLAAMHMRLPIYSSMTIFGGRKERFYTTIILIVSATLLIMVAMAFIVAISTALAPIMPDITLFGMDRSFHTTSPGLLIIPPIIIPIAFALRLVIYKKPFSTFVPIILVVMMMFAWFIRSSERFGALFTPTSLASLLILNWLVFAVVLRYVCMRRPLVGQNRTY
jgi:hypothetical protein